MTEINKRISELTKELNILKGILREYDSLIDYLEIYLSINGPRSKDYTSFGGRITIAITGGWNAELSLLQDIVVVFFAILPFMIIIIPAGAIIFVIYKVKKKE